MQNQNQKGFILPVIIAVVVVALLGVGGYFAYTQYSSQISQGDQDNAEDTGDNQDKNGVACTQEAMQCPDGSYVGRTGPNCEFTPCPETNAEKLITLTYGEAKKEISDIASRGEIDVNLIYPDEKTSANLYTECPNGVTGSGIKYTSWSNTVCNKRLDATYGGGYNFEFRNSTNQIQTVKMTYNVLTSDGKTHAQIIQFTVQPEK